MAAAGAVVSDFFPAGNAAGDITDEKASLEARECLPRGLWGKGRQGRASRCSGCPEEAPSPSPPPVPDEVLGPRPPGMF